jgi:hypothetical protein
MAGGGTPEEKKQFALHMEYANTPHPATKAEAIGGGLINGVSAGSVAAISKYVNGKTNSQDYFASAAQEHPLLYGAGTIAGYIAPGSLADKGVSLAAKPLLEKTGATIAGRIAGRSATAAISNAALVAASDKLQGASNSQTAKDAAIQGLVGGILGGGMSAIGERAAIKTATRELGAKGLITPASKIPSNIAKAAEDRAVANANRLLPAESNGTASARPKLAFDGKGNLIGNKPIETPTNAKLSPVVNDAGNKPFEYKPSTEEVNAKTWYHGSGTNGLTAKSLTPSMTKIEGLYGHGVYLTDDPKIAQKYAAGRSSKSGTPMVYEAKINLRNSIDLEKPLPENVYQTVRQTAKQLDDTYGSNIASYLDSGHSFKGPGTLLWRNFTEKVSELSQNEGVSSSELSEYFQDLTGRLKDLGYDGFTHVGGNIKGNKLHQVAVIFDPNDEFVGYKSGKPVRETTQSITSFSPSAAQMNTESVLKPADATISDGIGARNLISTPTKDLIGKYGQIDTGENPTRIMQVPNKTADNVAVSKYVRTVGESKNVTDGQAISLENKAAKGDFSHIIKTDKVAVANADKVISDEGISGSTRQWERISSGTKPATKEDMALAQQLLTEAYTRGDIAGAERLVSQITVEGTRSGQVVQSMRLLKKMTPQGKLYYLQKYVDKANSDLSLKIGDRATKIEISPELANQLLGATTAKDIGEAEKQIIIEVAKQTPATWGDRMNAWRYMSMLANPLTHLRNIYGNIFFQPVRKFASLITAGAEKVMRVPVGERTSSVLIPFKDKALKDFARNDYKGIGDILHGGKFNENSNIINDNKPIFVSKNPVLNTLQKPVEGLRKGSMWGLSHEDIFFSKPAYTDYMSQYMKSNKLTPEFLSSGTNEAEAALEKGRTYSIQQAKRTTFNEANSFATWINKSEKKLLQYGTPGKVGYMAIEGLTPFKKTPFNIVKRGLEYSPLNLIKSVSTDLIKVNAGKMEATDAIRHFAEGLTGTGLMGLGMFLSAQGLITGKVDTTGKQGDYDAQNGVQQYSLNIGNHSYTINWMAPEIMPVMMGSEIYSSFVKDNPKDAMGATTAAFNHLLSATSSITDPVFDLTMLQGVNNLFSQSFGSSAMQQIEKTIPSFAGQFVPTALGQVARISQPNRKDTSTSDPMNKLLGINKVVAKIPGLANSLPDKTDLWGKPISNGSLPLRLFSNLASPGYLGTKQNSPVDAEVQRLKTATNNTAALPAAAPSTITDPNTKKTIYMTAQEKALYQQIMGQTAFNALSQLINNPMYRSLPDQQAGATNDKLSFVSKVYTDARARAVNTILSNRNIHIPTAAQIKIANKLTPQQKSQSKKGTTLNDQIAKWTK